jgi:LemA protein
MHSALALETPSAGRSRGLRLALLALLATVLSGCGYNEIQSRDEAVKAAWAEVLSTSAAPT